jgi:hypothetical protein
VRIETRSFFFGFVIRIALSVNSFLFYPRLNLSSAVLQRPLSISIPFLLQDLAPVFSVHSHHPPIPASFPLLKLLLTQEASQGLLLTIKKKRHITFDHLNTSTPQRKQTYLNLTHHRITTHTMSSEKQPQHLSDTSSTFSSSTTFSLTSLLKKHDKNGTSSKPKRQPIVLSEEQRRTEAEARAAYFSLR